MTGTLRDVCAAGGLIQTGPFGSQLHASDYVDSGVPVIMPTNIGENRVVEEGIARVSEEMAKSLARHRLRAGDIVYSRRGDITRRALIRDEVGWLCGTGCLLVRPGNGTDPVWLSYWLGTPDTRSWLMQHAVGATMPNLNTEILGSVPVAPPPLDEQRRIAEVLGALDDLIDTNERLTADAAELRRSLLDAAFGVATEHHALSSIARFVNGKNFTKGADRTGRPIIRTPEVREGVKPATIRSSVDATDDFIARPGDLLFVWSGSLCLGRWVEDEALVNQHVFKVIPNVGVPDWYVYACLEWKLPWFLGLAADKATTMGHIQRAHLDAPVPKLSSVELEQLDARVGPLWELELELSRENAQLRRTRDELLPLLMSGAVRVRPEGVAA